MAHLLRTAWRGEDNCGRRAFKIAEWNETRRAPNRDSKSARISSASSWTDTSSCCKNGPIISLLKEQSSDTTLSFTVVALICYLLTVFCYITFSMAVLRRPVIRRQTLAARPLEANGSSLITVLRPMLEISRSCSLSETMLAHKASTMTSTWYSFTLLTKGPKLKSKWH